MIKIKNLSGSQIQVNDRPRNLKLILPVDKITEIEENVYKVFKETLENSYSNVLELVEETSDNVVDLFGDDIDSPDKDTPDDTTETSTEKETEDNSEKTEKNASFILPEDWDYKNKPDLIGFAEKLGLSIDGTKTDIIERIRTSINPDSETE